MRTPLRAWMFGVMVAILALVSGTAAQTPAKDMGEALGILPSGFGEAVDRDIMTIRDAATKLKTSEAAEAAGYRRVTGCVEHQLAGTMGYHFQDNALLDTTLDLEHPEMLINEKMPDGTFQLMASNSLRRSPSGNQLSRRASWGKPSRERIRFNRGASG